MNPLRKLAAWTAVKAANFAGQTFTTTDTAPWRLLNGGGTVVGKNVNDSSAMTVTAFFAGVRLLAETMGVMPSKIYETQKDGNSLPVDHDLGAVLIDQPNADMNGTEFREASTSNLVARGNAYSIIETRSDGSVLSLYPIPSSRVQVKRDSSTDWEKKYGIQDRGKTEWYPADKIWHRKGFSFDGLVGISPIQCAKEAIGLAMAGEEYNARLFGQGLMPSARVSIPAWLTDEQRKVANAKLLEMHTGLVNMNKPYLLEGGMKVEDGLLTPDDAQFLQLRQFTVIEICRMLGIKPHMIAALERATDNNIEKLGQEFVTYTMLPHMNRDEKAVRQLFKPADRGRFFMRYNAEGLLRADSAARAALYSILLQNGVQNRNGVRALEGWNRIEDPAMDKFTVQSNMAMIDQLVALVAARQAPPAPAPMPTPMKSGDTTFTVQLPNEMKHDISHEVQVSGITDLAAQVKRSNEASVRATTALSRQLDQLEETTKVLTKATLAPRRGSLEKDKDGNPTVISRIIGD
jgi:HK97 family phage portal protein